MGSGLQRQADGRAQSEEEEGSSGGGEGAGDHHAPAERVFLFGDDGGGVVGQDGGAGHVSPPFAGRQETTGSPPGSLPCNASPAPALGERNHGDILMRSGCLWLL